MNKFYLNVDAETKQVCKKYFLETFQISDGRMTRALKKIRNGEPAGDDKRGKKTPGNKTLMKK